MTNKLVWLALSLIVIGCVGVAIERPTVNIVDGRVVQSTASYMTGIHGRIPVQHSITNVVVNTADTSVTVTGSTGETVTYTGEIRVPGHEGQNNPHQAVQSEWSTKVVGNTLHLTLKQPLSTAFGGDWSGQAPYLHVVVPKGESVQVTTTNADVQLRSLSHNGTVQTSNADIVVSDIGGTANLVTSNGSVNLDNVLGPVTASDSNGEIYGTSPIGGDWSLRTSNAGISITVLRSTNAVIQASTSNASLNGNVGWNNAGVGQGTCRLGTGSRTVELVTSNGSITVNQS